MKARVINTGQIVELVTKQGDYYIDYNSNPYLEDELDFDVPIDARVSHDEDDVVSPYVRLLDMTGLQQAAQIAIQYMQNQPNASADRVSEFVTEVFNSIKRL